MKVNTFVHWGIAGHGGNHRGRPTLHLIQRNLDTTLCGLTVETIVADPRHQRYCSRCLRAYYALEEKTRELVTDPQACLLTCPDARDTRWDQEQRKGKL